MKLSVNWLKDYIALKLSTDELIERLTMAGLEIEHVESVGGDTVLEIEITPNRPDCLNVLGLAREIGAITGRKVKTPKIKNYKTARLKNFIHIENKNDCSRYIATLIKNARVTDAPLAMKQRLSSMGIKTINNAVDITNFVMMEMGQPLHAFDFDKLEGGKIIVRRAKDNESILTLDGVQRKLDASILVIADAKKPVAIAGIMGGRDTQITASTQNILLESAHFDMGLIRHSCRSLGLRSDSSYRFERNVDFEGVLTGANRATDLLRDLTGGLVSGRGEVVSNGALSSLRTGQRKGITVNLSHIESLLGTKPTTLKIKTWLLRLGFKVALKKQMLTVVPPSTRADIQQDVDVIEEIARMIGFDRLPSKLPRVKAVNIPVDKRSATIKKQIRYLSTAQGMDEIITHAMISQKALAKCGIDDKTALRIFNPLSADQELMRPALLPSFLQIVQTNVNRGQKDLRLFEIGKRYLTDGERETAGFVLMGRRARDWRRDRKEGAEIFDLKGVLENIFQRLGINAEYKATPQNALDTSCSVAIRTQGKLIGFMGKIDRKILNNWDLKNQDVYFGELYLDALMDKTEGPKKFQPISEYPAIVRDVSLTVKQDIAYKKIEELCLRQGGDILKSVHFIEQYLGDKIQLGSKGLVFSLHYQSDTKTLREDEVAGVHERLVQSLLQELGASRR